MPGNSATVSIAIEVDDKGSVKIRQLGEAARKAGDEGARGFEAMGKSATGAERGINTMSTSLKALGGLAAAVAASAIVQQIAQIGSAAIQAASDMEETQGKFDVVFQGMTAQAEAWAGELRANFAMSSLEAKRFMGDIQNMLVPAGLMREEAGKMSFELTKLSADLGSFNNMPTEQVFRDIMSALQGSTETMDKYGINVRQTLVEQKALNMGLAATAKELTHADRLTATYALIVEQAGDAIGDTARTSESFANQQKQLNANLEEVRITIGQALLPEVNKITTDMNAWFKENEAVLKQDLATWAGTAAGAINILAAAAHAGAVAIGTIDAALGKLGISYSSMADKWNAYSDSFQVVWEQATGVRDTKTGSFIDQQAVKIDGLQTKLAGLQQQAAATGDTFTTGFEVSLGGSTAASDKLNAEITETQAQLDAARSASTLFQEGIKTSGVDVNNLANYTDELSVSTDGATTSTTKLGQAATDTAKALDTKSASTRTAAKSAEDMAREDERIGRQMLADHATRVKATQELTDNLNEHARQGAEEKRKALADQLKLEYADEAANVDDKMKLEQDHADWVRGLQEGLLRDIEAGIGDFVYGFLTGEFDSIGDAFESLCDSILRAFANLIAEMVAKWAMSGIMGLFTGQGFGGFNVAAMGLGPGGVTSGWGDSISSLIGGGSSVALSQYGPYASGYATGGGAAGASGMSAAGAGLGVAGGAYGLYNAAGQVASGNANAGTALQAGISAYSIYKGYPVLASYLSSLGSTTAAAGTAAAYTGAGSLAYGSTGSVVMNAMAAEQMGTAAGSAIVAETTAAGTTAASGASSASMGAAGGGAGAGLSTGAMVGGGAITAIGALIALNMGGKAQQNFTDSRGFTHTWRDYGHDDQQDVRRAGMSGLDWVAAAEPGSMSGSGDSAITQTTADLDRAYEQFQARTTAVLDILANQFGDGIAALGVQLDAGAISTDTFVDAVAGYDVGMAETAAITQLAAESAHGSESAMRQLRASLISLGMSEQSAETAMLGLVSASRQGQSALQSAAGAVRGMTGAVRTFSSTPLNIRVNVGVREQPYRIDNSNPYAEHAVGGIFKSATLIPSIRGTKHLVGEAGPEAILPLPDPDILQRIHDRLADGGSGRPVQIVFQVDGKTFFDQVIAPHTDAMIANKASRGMLGVRARF